MSINSFYDYKKLILKNDDSLRQNLNLNINGNESEVIENHHENDFDQNEIIKLDPNKVYESSDDELSNHENAIQSNNYRQNEIEQNQVQKKQDKVESIIKKKPCNASTRDKMEIFHCKYCDVVFSEIKSCMSHELNHDQLSPYECNICPFKTNQHPQLIIHIKHEHNTEKPFFCVVCSKSFIRRSDLRKHIFVHAGIRLFSCNLCQKSFTRSTNLAKHKRTHLENQQKKNNFKCRLCPQAFATNAELSTHMEMHMTRNTFNCKFCNQVFTQRDELEYHQQSHIAQMKTQSSLLIPQQPQSTSIVFYNQNPMEQHQSGMNFYKENADAPPPPMPQPKIEYPIMNQLLSNNFNSSLLKCDKCMEQFPSLTLLQSHQSMFHSKNFACALCSCSYYKKKELDRHIMSAHTDIKYNCSKCSKSFSRKDKLTRHEKTHLVPAFFNCALCPAIFIRKNLLDLHSKIHMMPVATSGANMLDGILPMNFEQPQQAQQLAQPPPQMEMTVQEQPAVLTSESYDKQPSPLDLSPMKVTDQPAILYPINLTMNQENNEQPMDLSNEKHYDDESASIVNKIELPKIVIESDDDDLKIIENSEQLQPNEIINPQNISTNNNNSSTESTPKTETLATTSNDSNLMNSIDSKNVDDHDLPRFHMKASNFDLDTMEPTKDLPMEILESPGI